jgi:KipI family sensor histidine kinase inhibitor
VVLESEPPISLDNQKRIWQLAQRLKDYPNVQEVVPGMNNITVLFSDARKELLDFAEHMQQCWEESQTLEPLSRIIDIPVIYGGEYGPDLMQVAEHCGLTPHQVVESHASADYVVYFIGFQPGFPYLGGMPEILTTPRHAQPRLSVPAGTVGIGGAQTGIYPLATPGGWQLIGRTSLSLFDPEKSSPTLLQPGDHVRFVPAKEGVC